MLHTWYKLEDGTWIEVMIGIMSLQEARDLAAGCDFEAKWWQKLQAVKAPSM
jgi:hypothetical protein